VTGLKGRLELVLNEATIITMVFADGYIVRGSKMFEAILGFQGIITIS
jgi:hypothetical protein